MCGGGDGGGSNDTRGGAGSVCAARTTLCRAVVTSACSLPRPGCCSSGGGTSTSTSASASCWGGTAVGGIDHPEWGTIGHDSHHRGGRTTFAGRGSTVCGAWGAGAAVTTAMVGTIVGVSARACPTRRCPTRAWRRTARAWFVRTSGGTTAVPSASVRHCS